MISAVDGHVSSPRTRHRKKKARKKSHTLCLRMVAALDRQRQRLVPLRRVVGTTTRERERERGERGREREEEGRGGEREKGEREKRGREIEGALNFFPHLPCAVSSSFRRLLHPGDSQESLFLIVSPFSFLPSPFSSHSPNVPLPPAGRNIKHHGDNPVFIRAPFSPVSGNGRPRDGRRPELECAKRMKRGEKFPRRACRARRS